MVRRTRSGKHSSGNNGNKGQTKRVTLVKTEHLCKAQQKSWNSPQPFQTLVRQTTGILGGRTPAQIVIGAWSTSCKRPPLVKPCPQKSRRLSLTLLQTAHATIVMHSNSQDAEIGGRESGLQKDGCCIMQKFGITQFDVRLNLGKSIRALVVDIKVFFYWTLFWLQGNPRPLVTSCIVHVVQWAIKAN